MRSIHLLSSLVVLALTIAVPTLNGNEQPVADARTIIVDVTGSGEYTAIQSALDAAQDGDTVLVKPGEYVITESIDFNRLHDPDDPASPSVKNIILQSEAGAEVTTIRMAEEPADPHRASAVIFESGEIATSVLEGFTIRESPGAGVQCIDSSPALKNCTIVDNGYVGVGCSGASPTIENCLVSRNLRGGVSCSGEPSPTLTNCTISGNWGGDGGGVYCENSSPTLVNCTISGNSVSADLLFGGAGGGVHSVEASAPTLRNCTIAANSADTGGGVFCGGGWGGNSLTLENCIVWDNVGEAIVVDSEECTLRVTYSCVQGAEPWLGEGNTHADPLFCGWSSAELWVSDQAGFEDALGFRLSLSSASPCLGTGANGADMGSQPRGCEAPGEIRRLVHLAAGTYTISEETFAHRLSLAGAGQAETLVEGTVHGLRTGTVLSDVTVMGGPYGGIRVTGGEAPEISNCTISRAESTSQPWVWPWAGGGVYCSASSPTLRNCTISGNRAWFGGGVYCRASSPTLRNCRISGNSALQDGGGVYCDRGSSPALVNCTISGNRASRNGCGVFAGWNDGCPTLTNCIVVREMMEIAGAPAPCWAALFMAPDCIRFHPDLWEDRHGDPLFVRRGHWDDNGTPDDPDDDTWIDGDYHLQVGSPCIDAGTSEGALATDIEGNPRPCGVGVDIGAYEFQTEDCATPPSRLIRSDCNDDGTVDISDAISTLGVLLLGQGEITCRDACDSNDDGAVDISDAITTLGVLFLGNGVIPPPGMNTCGVDPTEDEVGCMTFGHCP